MDALPIVMDRELKSIPPMMSPMRGVRISLTRGAANDDTDSHVEDVAAGNEFFKFLEQFIFLRKCIL